MRTITIEIDTCRKCPHLDCEKRIMIDAPSQYIPRTCPIWLAAEKAKAETAKRIANVVSESTCNGGSYEA